MLLDRSDHALAQCSDWVRAQLSDELAKHTLGETHAAVIELVTGVHLDAAGAVAELAGLRERLALELRPLGVVAACAGMPPLASSEEVRVSGAERYRLVADSMRSLARREPTLALHVHVGVPDPEDAIRLLNRLRETVPVLLALSSNSPFSGGRDSGFASARTAVFGGFPRTGPPRAFACYADYVEAIDPLIASGALPDASFLWWDVRLQPALGTVEVRVMDAQTSVAESAPLIALIQSLARLELEGEPRDSWVGPEILAENRFLAARDGIDARLIELGRRELVPVRTFVEALLRECRPHAAALRCSAELERVSWLAAANGAKRQQTSVSEDGDLVSLVSALAEQFIAQREAASDCTHRSGRSD